MFHRQVNAASVGHEKALSVAAPANALEVGAGSKSGNIDVGFPRPGKKAVPERPEGLLGSFVGYIAINLDGGIGSAVRAKLGLSLDTIMRSRSGLVYADIIRRACAVLNIQAVPCRTGAVNRGGNNADPYPVSYGMTGFDFTRR